MVGTHISLTKPTLFWVDDDFVSSIGRLVGIWDGLVPWSFRDTPPKTNIEHHRTWKLPPGRGYSFWKPSFSGSMLNLGGFLQPKSLKQLLACGLFCFFFFFRRGGGNSLVKRDSCLHRGKLTWNTNMEVWFRWFSFSKRWFLVSMLIFRGVVVWFQPPSWTKIWVRMGSSSLTNFGLNRKGDLRRHHIVRDLCLGVHPSKSNAGIPPKNGLGPRKR